MTHAIIGAGNIGSAVARRFVAAGLPVAVAAGRGPAAVAPLAEELGPLVTAAEVHDALAADIVILAVPFEAVRGVVDQVPDWGGRIVVDATNAIDYQTFSPADLGGRPSSDLVADWAVNARVVKSFGSTWARVLARDPEVGGGRRVLFVSGDHQDANAEVASLIEALGFAAIDLGRSDAGGLLQQFGGPLTTLSLISQPIGGATPAEMDVVDR
ncbi:NADPH-dependent F420 reductase [Mycolicibacterium sediminis]|uniref:NADP oxidoreductase n=1 Tax=Mycolicibacterium sediminis TaxID=1286180 RepID=A0A7I7QQQ1_9MYCO|nr:NADPH-dependent F420 reductase [Mycolicibacterium sediminis]BBY28718.1 NADP oxidoreductase [Mycolicibacterium sediminis]